MSDHTGMRHPDAWSEREYERAQRELPTADELPDELDAPAPAPTVRVGEWEFRTVPCRTGCGARTIEARGGMCDYCFDLYNAQR